MVGTLPEPGGYAIAKFSRSARPYQEWIQELTQDGASRFYEQFYFAYGHASIADLAHLTMVAENISIVAAIELLDEPLVDAQESSTRYQDFTRRRFFTPPELLESPHLNEYRECCDALFDAYHRIHRALTTRYEQVYAADRPADLADDEYRRTLRARAFDVARYLLPSSTYTGLGYLCSARTLERQVSRFAAHDLDELREISLEMKRAATEPAYNPLALQMGPYMEAYAAAHPEIEGDGLLDQIRQATLTGAPAAPTLVRYTEPSAYPRAFCESARLVAAQVVGDTTPDGSRGVTLSNPVPPEEELAATVLYRGSEISYRQALTLLGSLSTQEIQKLAEIAYAGRGPHDSLVREARVGFQLVFDLCLDNGAFRDLHRHRNCVQIIKDFTPSYGYDTPDDLRLIEAQPEYQQLMDRAGALAERLDELKPGLGQYALPLAYRRRALFKMDAAQLGYIVEQRTAPAGHFSYREIAHQMFGEFQRQHPTLARHIRATEPTTGSFFDR
ncbi:MAG: alternative thymidylate synthase [Chloroflexi bacterium]|nr:alternative thymidylate synthase [Chloroflexota bacterium]